MTSQARTLVTPSDITAELMARFHGGQVLIQYRQHKKIICGEIQGFTFQETYIDCLTAREANLIWSNGTWAKKDPRGYRMHLLHLTSFWRDEKLIFKGGNQTFTFLKPGDEHVNFETLLDEGSGVQGLYSH